MTVTTRTTTKCDLELLTVFLKGRISDMMHTLLLGTFSVDSSKGLLWL